MSGKPNTAWLSTMVEKHGDKGELKKHMQEIGARGGRAKNPNKGFGSDRKRASEAGRRGGLKSKKTKVAV